MVKVNFKIFDIDSLEFSLEKHETLASVLKQCTARTGIELGGIIAIRNGQVIQGNCLVEDRDEINLLPAISGG